MTNKKKRSRLPAGVTLIGGKLYRVRATYKAPHHPRRSVQTTLPPGTTLAQAVEVREQLLAELRGEAAPPASVPRLADYLESWLKRKVPTISKKTAETYTWHLAHLDADLGGYPLDEIERRHLVWWRDQLQSQVGDLASSTVQRRWSYGVQVIKDGLAEYELVDITRRLGGPTGKTTPRREQRTYTAEEVAKACDAVQGRYRSLVRFLARTGCRLSEAAGLRWCDIDLDEHPHARLRQGAVELEGGEWEIKVLKNGFGRVVGLSPDLVEALKEHRVECPGVGKALVWATRTGKPPKRTYVYRVQDAAAKRVDLEIRLRPQVLRRTMNSLGLAAGLDPVLLQELIGHADNDMTRLYAGLRPETAARAVKEVWG
jgi:integrase